MSCSRSPGKTLHSLAYRPQWALGTLQNGGCPTPTFNKGEKLRSFGGSVLLIATRMILLKGTLEGRLGGSVGWAADYGSGHDLAVRGFEPRVGLCADSSEPGACLGFWVSLSLSLPCSRSASTCNALPLSSTWRIPAHALKSNAIASGSGLAPAPSWHTVLRTSRYRTSHLPGRLYVAIIHFCVCLPVNCAILRGGAHGCPLCHSGGPRM